MEDNPKEKSLEFDELLTEHVGEFGKKQKILSLLLTFSCMTSCVHMFAIMFTGGTPAHWCSVESPVLENCTVEQRKALTIPTEVRDAEVVYQQCKMYSIKNSSAWEAVAAEYCRGGNNDNHLEMENMSIVLQEFDTSSCSSWEYDTSFFLDTIVIDVSK